MIIAVTNKQRRQAVLVLAIALLLAILVKLNFIIPVALDGWMHSWFNSFQSNFGDVIMTIATFLGNPVVDIVYTLILAGVLILARLRIPAVWAIITLLTGDIVLKIIQFLIQRSRPVGHLIGDSSPAFPSGHVFGLFVVIFIVSILIIPNINNIAIQFTMQWAAFLIGGLTLMSRIYFNANFFSDTIAAILFAYGWVVFAATCYAKLAKYLKARIPFFKYDEI